MMEVNIRGIDMHHAARTSMMAALLAGICLPSMAQGQNIAPTREEIQRQEIERDLRGRAAVLALDSDVERAPCPLADPQFADLRFTLAEAQFSGLGSIDPAQLEGAWSAYTGQEIPVASICEIRDRAATILRQAGYLAAVQVPEQTIDEGIVRFDVVLARLSATQVRGDVGNAAGLLERYISRLEGQEVFNTRDAERYLLLARDIPGIDVRLTLQPMPRETGAQPGEVVGVFDVSRQPFYADLTAQNYGSKSVGRFGGVLRAQLRDITGLGDQSQLSFYSTADFSEQLVIQGSHEFKLGSQGLTLGLGANYAWTRPDVTGPDVFESDTLVASAYALYPLVRSQNRDINISGGFDLIDQSVDFGGSSLSQDNLRVAFARIDYRAIDRDSIVGRGGFSAIEPKRAWGLSLELRQGLGILGASDGCGAGFALCAVPGVVPISRFDADPDGFLVRGEMLAEYRPMPELGLRLRSRFQYSPDELLNYEQFSGGSYTIGRGYDPGAVIGDSGLGLQLEAFYGSQMPATPNAAAWQPYVFGDFAGTWTNNLVDDYSRIISAGAGVRATIGRQAVFDLTATVPLETPPFAAERGDVRILMSLTVQLWPWKR